jgi:hypothetical protein
VKVADVAMPLALVVAFVVLESLPANVPLDPVAGAVNATTTPLAGPPFVVTDATNACPNAPSIAWLCGVPLVAVIDTTGVTSLLLLLGLPVVQLVRPIRQIKASTLQ